MDINIIVIVSNVNIGIVINLSIFMEYTNICKEYIHRMFIKCYVWKLVLI